MSFGGSTSSGKSWYKPAAPYLNEFMGVGQDWLNQWDPSGGQFRKAGQDEILKTAQGAYGDPATNPALSRTLANIDTNARGYQADAFNQAGGRDTGNFVGSTQQDSQARMQGMASQDVTDRLNQMLMGNYTGEQSNRVKAAQDAIAQGQLPYDQAFRIMQAFGGMGSSKSQSTPSILGTLI
jgi:hypothetical protein